MVEATLCTALLTSEEQCNSIDDDCDGKIDEELPTVSCGVGLCERTLNLCYQSQLLDPEDCTRVTQWSKGVMVKIMIVTVL